MNSDVKVQVICVTYNQKDYIREALDSFLMQKTNFKFEVLVGDDCSTDGTSEIVAEYAQKYPEIIKHIRREPNMGCLENFMDLCERADAKYVAFCDGDDYWTDENKLQKQFDFMEKNEDVNICSHLTNIVQTCETSYNNYYLHQRRGLVIPARLELSKRLSADKICNEIPHLSSLFIRHTLQKFPDWIGRKGVMGDCRIIFLELGAGYLYCMKEAMSVYRKCPTGVFSDVSSINDFFVKTRPEYIKLFSNLIKYYKTNFPTVSLAGFNDRLKRESLNFLNGVVSTDDWQALVSLKEEYPEGYSVVKNILVQYKQMIFLRNKIGNSYINLFMNNFFLKLSKLFLLLLTPFVKAFNKVSVAFKAVHTFLAYWVFALMPKKKNLWVFSGFFKKNYMDNTRYLYEYIQQNHPEIDAVWLTKDKVIHGKLKQLGFPVYRMNSIKGIWSMIRASVAFSDHFKMSDYDPRYGFNARTKFVNIFHGFGPKGMKPIGEQIPNTSVFGVRLSSDILFKNEDSVITKLVKICKYPFVAPFRELFEEYFGMVCPGTPCNEFFANPWHVKSESQLKCGYPRSSNLYKIDNISDNNKFKIIYAPTYRWNPEDEHYMINNLINNIPRINNLMELINGEFVFRLHPHTWRSYQNSIIKAIKDFDRFSFNTDKDIYDTLNEYSLLITDYSSLGWEFLQTGKPAIYFAFDYDTYNSTDCPFDMDYEYICGGNFVKDWDNLLAMIKEYYLNPTKNIDKRESIRELFYPSSYNDINNSERLVNLVKEKLRGK